MASSRRRCSSATRAARRQECPGFSVADWLERYARSEKARVAALAEMYVQGVSTRKVRAITEELCGHSFSASAISSINKSLDETLERFATRQLEEAYPYLIVDARYSLSAPPTPYDGGRLRRHSTVAGARDALSKCQADVPGRQLPTHQNA